jgi:hypothetical protein
MPTWSLYGKVILSQGGRRQVPFGRIRQFIRQKGTGLETAAMARDDLPVRRPSVHICSHEPEEPPTKSRGVRATRSGRGMAVTSGFR